MVCTVGGIRSDASGLTSLIDAVLALQGAFVEQRLNRLFHEEWRAAGRLDDELLERQQGRATPQHRRQHLIGIVLSEGVEPHAAGS